MSMICRAVGSQNYVWGPVSLRKTCMLSPPAFATCAARLSYTRAFQKRMGTVRPHQPKQHHPVMLGAAVVPCSRSLIVQL